MDDKHLPAMNRNRPAILGDISNQQHDSYPGSVGESVVNVLWKHPTPHEQSLAQYDAFIAIPANRFEMERKVRLYGLTVRHWALRHLRIWAAIHRIHSKRVLTEAATKSAPASFSPKEGT